MYIWVVRNGFGDDVDYFTTAEGAYSYMASELSRWNDEYPLDVPDSLAYALQRRLDNGFKENSSCFEVGELGTTMDWYLKATRVEVKE